MPARRDSSPQTRAVLSALSARASDWRHGYDISRETGLASGTLYPILGRLADRRLLATRWEDDAPPGRPRRHLYRLTPAGAELARQLRHEPAPATVARRRPAVAGP